MLEVIFTARRGRLLMGFTEDALALAFTGRYGDSGAPFRGWWRRLNDPGQRRRGCVAQRPRPCFLRKGVIRRLAVSGMDSA